MNKTQIEFLKLFIETEGIEKFIDALCIEQEAKWFVEDEFSYVKLRSFGIQRSECIKIIKELRK
jgi:hypothetical protein